MKKEKNRYVVELTKKEVEDLILTLRWVENKTRNRRFIQLTQKFKRLLEMNEK